ncbi:choice-of-anchor D domain-containing protein [Deferrisoma camini]|uniref:choice-of-anchor D domain-containing protein n=1 Tax=Deferrisoma camini TaxID=1035120 RepID=UPI00046D4D7A|nr:choice-of-anchor D domain-containing protein [Deferrisoma camini]
MGLLLRILLLTGFGWLPFVLASCGGGGGGSGRSPRPPEAAFTADPTAGAAPLAVSFDASASSDPDGSIASYAWDFGDGATAEGAVVSHTYRVQGTHTVRLTVTDDEGAQAFRTLMVTVVGLPVLQPLPRVTTQPTVTVQGLALPDAVVALENRTTGKTVEVAAGEGPFEAAVDLAEGANEIAVTTRLDGVKGPPAVLEVAYLASETIGLDSISPSAGPAGALVTLTGSGFGTDPEAVEVFFRAAPFEGGEDLDLPAAVLEVTDTEIRAAVPFGFLNGAQAQVFVIKGGDVSGALPFTIEAAKDPTPDTAGNEADQALELVADQIRALRGTLEQLAGENLPQETRDALLGNLDRIGAFLQELRGRLKAVPDPGVQARIDAILGSPVLAEALADLGEANGQLRRIAQRAAQRAARGLPDAGASGCDVAEVVEALQAVLQPVRIVAGVLNAVEDALYAMLVGSSIGCAFGIVPACVAIPIFSESIAVISAVSSVLDAILGVVDYVVDALYAVVPTFPSEWKIVIDQPISGLSNDVLYTGTTNTLSLYANFTNAPFREFLAEHEIDVNLPDPFGVIWLVKKISGYDIEAELEEVLGDLVVELVADITGVNFQVTEVDRKVPFTVAVASGGDLVSATDGGSSREDHTLVAGEETGWVELDIRASCGAYSYPDRTKCVRFFPGSDLCLEWGTDYPPVHTVEVLDKPRIESIGDWIPAVYVDQIPYDRCTINGVNLCTMEEYEEYIEALCSDDPTHPSCRLFDTCYDPESRTNLCGMDDYASMLDALCADHGAACDDLIHTTYGVSYDYGYRTVTGKGFSTRELSVRWNPGSEPLSFATAGSREHEEFLLYANPYLGYLKPGWIQVTIGAGLRLSDPVFVEPSPNLEPEARVLNPGVFPGDRLYVEGNYFTPFPDDIVLTKVGTSQSWHPDPFPVAGGFADEWGLAWFTGPGESLPEGSHAFTLGVGPDPACPGPRCTSGNFTVLPHRNADDAPDLRLAGPGAFMAPRAVAVGDLNGDGLPDLAVGVPTYTNFYEVGAVFLRFGTTEGWGELDLADENAWDVRILGDVRDVDPDTRNTRRIGNALAVGDLDGDGIDDLVIGSTDRNPDTGAHGTLLDPEGAHLPGKAYVLFGRTAWEQGYEFTLDQYDARFVGADDRELGEAVAVAHVGSSDARADLVLGAPSAGDGVDGSDPGPGRVYVIRGWGFTLPDKTVNLPDQLAIFPYAATIEGAAEPFSSVVSFAGGEVAEHRADRFGASLAVADVDGDGLGDLVIGAPGYAAVTATDPLTAQEGAVYLFRGRSWFGPPGAALRGTLRADALAGGDQDAALLGPAVTSDAERTGFGTVVHAGDLTGDGRAEVILGAPDAVLRVRVGPMDLERERAGRVYVIEAGNEALASGAAANVDEVADLTVHGSTGFVRLGCALASGDLNQDGFPDLVVGAPGDRADEDAGRVWILWGSASPPWRAAGRDALYLETRSWQAASSDSPHLSNGEDYAYLGSGDSSALSPRFGAAVAVVDLPPHAGTDLLVIDAGADLPDGSEADGVRGGAGAVLGFFGAGEEAFLARPVIGAKPSAVDLGTLLPDQEASVSVRLRNDALAPARDLEIQGTELTGDEGFSLDLAPSLPQTLAPGGEQELRLDVLFAGAAEPGAYRATLVVRSDDPVTPRLAIPLTATVREAFPTVSVDDVYFSAREFTKVLRVENQGTADLEWTLVEDWYGGEPWPGWLTASATEGTTGPEDATEVTLSVDRSGLELGTHVYSLYVTSNDPNNPSVPVMVVVSVEPLPDVAVEPASLSFEIRPGWNVTNTVQVTNEGDADLAITGVTLSGFGDFSRWDPDDACGETLAPGETCSVGIGFSRDDEGTSTATLTIATDDPDEPVVEVQITGTATIPQEPDIAVIGANATFGGVPIGSTRTWDITVKNEGAVDLHVTDVTVSRAPEFSLASNGCTDPVPPFTGSLSQLCTITVAFTPTGTEQVTGEIQIRSDDPDEPVVTGSLSGAGITPFLYVSPTVMDFGDTAFSAGFSLENLSSTETLDWSVAGALPSWLGVFPDAGQLAAGGRVDVALTADRTGLDPGSYSFDLSLTSNGGDDAVTVQLTVPAPGEALASFARTYGGASDDELSFLRAAPDGGLIAAGRTKSFGAGNTDAWLVKLDPSGDLVWAKTYGGADYDRAYAVTPTSDGGYAVVGGTWSWHAPGDNWYGLWVWKVDRFGYPVWQKVLGGHPDDYDDKWEIAETADGGLLLAGMNSVSRDDAWILKLDADGTLVWQKAFGTDEVDRLYALDPTPDLGAVAAGLTCASAATGCDVLVVRLDSAGEIAWQKSYGGAGYDHAWAVRAVPSGGYVVAGLTDSFGPGNENLWVLRLDAGGNVLWQRAYGLLGGFGEANAVAPAADGGFLIGGWLARSGSDPGDLWLLRLDANGEVLWSRTYGGSEYERAEAVVLSADGAGIASGFTASTGAGYWDGWILKVDGIGNVGPTCTLVGYADVAAEDTSATVADAGLTPRPIEVTPADTSAATAAPNAVAGTACSETEADAALHTDPQIQVTPDSWDAGFVEMGVMTVHETFTVRNTGYADLDLLGIALDPALADFGVVDDCPATLPPTHRCSVTVGFTPTQEGVQTTTLVIESSDPDEPVVEVPVSGEGFQGGAFPGEEPGSGEGGGTIGLPTPVTPVEEP